jgi:hypothetical protein
MIRAVDRIAIGAGPRHAYAPLSPVQITGSLQRLTVILGS